MLFLAADEITIRDDRIRRTFEEDYLSELASSISSKGLMHPITVRKMPDGSYELVAGENRYKSCTLLHSMEVPFNCNSHTVPKDKYPCLLLSDLPEDLRLEAELEENTHRRDLPWPEQAAARKKLLELRQRQATARGETFSAQALSEELTKSGVSAASTREIIRDVQVAKYLDDPKIAGAKTKGEALKLVAKKKQTFFLEALGKMVQEEGGSKHELHVGDCRLILPNLAAGSFSVICTDPPYGIGIDDAGSQVENAHHYDDSPEALDRLMDTVPAELFRVAAPNAHLYWFCDLKMFARIREDLEESGWDVLEYPLFWNKNGRGIAPDPRYRPRRTYETILFASKGDRPFLKLAPDVITVTPTADLQQAEKPVELLVDLLSRSCQPGDTVLDFCCGSGSIFLAASELDLSATGIELDANRASLARSRLGGKQ